MLKYNHFLCAFALLLLTACGTTEGEKWGYLDYSAVNCAAAPQSAGCQLGEDINSITAASRSRSR